MAAQDIRRHFASEYTGIYVGPPTDGNPFYKVRIGRFLLREARSVQDLLRREANVDPSSSRCSRDRIHQLRQGKGNLLQLSKSGQRTMGRVDRAPSHAAPSNSLLMN